DGAVMSSREFPARSVGRVLDGDAGFDEFAPDRIGGGVVSTSPGILAFGEFLFDPAGEVFIDARGATGEGEDAEDVVGAFEGGAHLLEVCGAERSRPVEGGVGLADEGEEGCECFGYVEVVVQGVLEAGEGAPGELREFG